MKKSLLKKVSVLTVTALLCSSLGSLSSFADSPDEQGAVLENVLATEQVPGISTDVELSEEVLSEDFDLVKAAEEMPSINDMNMEEKKLFDDIVQEQVELAGLQTEEEKELFAQAMYDFFDETSDTYNDLVTATDELEKEIYELEETTPVEGSGTEVSVVEDVLSESFGVATAHAIQVKVGVKFAGAVFNGIIGFAVGGGVGAIQSFIIKKGKEEAKRLFTKTVVSKLKAWGAPKLALAAGAAVTVALNYMDVGTTIAKQLDKRDKRPNNGWIDLY